MSKRRPTEVAERWYQHPTNPSIGATAPWKWKNTGNRLDYGQQIVGYRLTTLGARFAAWRRRRNGAMP